MGQLAGVAMALVSAVTGASAHAMLKAGRDKLAIRALIALTSGLAAAPWTIVFALPTAALWRWLLLAAALHTIYQFVLAAAYDAADFVVAYPLARGLVPLSTAIVAVLLLGDTLTPLAACGVVAVSIGLLAIALRAGVAVAGVGWAVAAGLLTTTYTVVDGHAVRLASAAGTFIAWFFVLDALFMVPLVSWLRRGDVMQRVRVEGRQGFIAGLLSLITYGSALLALRLLPVGAASSLRETSVVFGAAIARLSLGEHLDRRRAVGVALIAIGGALVVAGVAHPR